MILVPSNFYTTLARTEDETYLATSRVWGQSVSGEGLSQNWIDLLSHE
jgi:hypothetical protein